MPLRNAYRRNRRRFAKRKAMNIAVKYVNKLRRGVGRSRYGGIAQPIQYFKRSAYQVNFITSGVVDSFKNLTFRLQDVPQYTEFTSLYDQYCIKLVKIELIPRFNSGEVGLSSTPPIWSIIDKDGSFPTTNAQMLQYQNLKIKTSFGPHKRVLAPAIATELFETPVGTAYAPKQNVFIDASYVDVPHYGATIMIPANVGVGEPVSWDLRTTFYLAMKNVR